MIIKCSQCGKEKYISILLKDYVYKLKDKTDKMHYFCNYNCKRQAEREYPERWMKRRDL